MTISDVVIKYDDLILSDYFDLLEEPEMGLFAPVNNEVVRMGNSVKLVDSHTGANTINLKVFSTKGDWRKLKDDLSLLARDQELHKLWFSHEPDRYYLCKLDGDSRLARSLEYKNEASGVISFIVPDGKSHAINRDVFTAALNSDGIMEMIVNNEGTETTPLSFTADIKSDNGYLGVVTENGAMEFGKIDEVDGHVYQATDIAAVNPFNPSDKNNWIENSIDAKVSYPISTNGLANVVGKGYFEWPAGSEGPTPKYTNRAAKIWAGPTLHRKLPTNSNGKRDGNFEWIWRFEMLNDKPQLTGRQEMNLQNSSKVPFAIVVRDSYSSKIDMTAEFKIDDGNGYSITQAVALDVKKLRSRYFEAKITRMGSKITFRIANIKSLKGTGGNQEVSDWYYQISRTFTDDRFKSIPVDATTYWPHVNDVMFPYTYMSPMNFIHRWINVDKWADDPNRYMNGDVLTYDGGSGKFFVNEVISLGDIVQGSTDIKIPPGEHKVQFYYSDFVKVPPIIKGTIRKRWL